MKVVVHADAPLNWGTFGRVITLPVAGETIVKLGEGRRPLQLRAATNLELNLSQYSKTVGAVKTLRTEEDVVKTARIKTAW